MANFKELELHKKNTFFLIISMPYIVLIFMFKQCRHIIHASFLFACIPVWAHPNPDVLANHLSTMKQIEQFKKPTISDASDIRLSSSHWLMRFPVFDILVIKVPPIDVERMPELEKKQKAIRVEAAVLSQERSQVTVLPKSIRFNLMALPEHERTQVEQGGVFIVYTPLGDLSVNTDPLLSAAIPLTDEALMQLRAAIPIAKQMTLMSFLLASLVCLLPLISLWAHYSVRQKNSHLPPTVRSGRASAALSLCVLQLSLALLYEFFAAQHFPGPRLDWIALAPFCLASMIISINLLEIWVKAEAI